MRIGTNRSRTFFRALAAFGLLLVGTAAAAAAIDSEGELVERTRLVGNLGVAHADLGLYPDRADVNPAPEPNGGTASISVPEGSEIVQTLVYWAGRGPDWSDPNIVVNGQSIDADIDYRWDTPSYSQSTYVADVTTSGLIAPGQTALNISGADQGGERFYGVGFLVVYEDTNLPEVELQLLEGNEFAFFDDSFFDEVGEAAIHTSVHCSQFSPSIEDREINSFSRIMGVDAGRSDAPPRSQRLQWWTGSEAVQTPLVDGLVQIPAQAPQGSIDNPVDPKVPFGAEWGSDTVETTVALAAGETHHCNQVQSVNIDDGAGASLSLTNQGGSAAAVYRLGNLIWLDVDDDGMAEIGEPGIDGVSVELFREDDDTPLTSTVTENDGSYAFEGLVCGNYRVEIPGGQSAWTIAGQAVNPDDLAPSSVVNPEANDDSDNDNNGVDAGEAISSGLVQIGDCGEDGDFADDASNEPTNEVDRKNGPDDDPDADSFDDVRSNVSVDIGLVGDIVCDADGNVVVDGEQGVDGAAAANCDDDDDDGDIPVEVGGTVECPGGTDRAGEVIPAGESCNNDGTPNICDADGNVIADGEEGVDGASSANCNDDEDIPVEVAGTTETADPDAEPNVLAITGVSSRVYLLSGLMVAVLGLWFMIAGAWFRPQGHRS